MSQPLTEPLRVFGRYLLPVYYLSFGAVDLSGQEATAFSCSKWVGGQDPGVALNQLVRCVEQTSVAAVWPQFAALASNQLIYYEREVITVAPDSVLRAATASFSGTDTTVAGLPAVRWQGPADSIARLLLKKSVPFDYVALRGNWPTVTRAMQHLLHEQFHRFQYANFARFKLASWGTAPAEAARSMSLPFREATAAEGALLSAALHADSLERVRCHIDYFVALREIRTTDDPRLNMFESDHERIEGTAQYVGFLGAGLAAGEAADLAANAIASEVIRVTKGRPRYYNTGAAMAFLLDRFKAEWKSDVQNGAYLLDVLRQAIQLRTPSEQARHRAASGLTPVVITALCK